MRREHLIDILIAKAQVADEMARECRHETERRGRHRQDAPLYRRLAFEHRQEAREHVREGEGS